MSEWKKVKLGEVANIFSGYAFKSQDMNSTGGIPLIKIKNIADFIVSTNCDSFLNKNVDVTKWEKYKLQADDFLIAMTGQGSVGRVGKMMSFSPSYYVNQRVAIVRPDATIINPYFLYKCFATKERENELFNKANGAGQPNISPSQIGEIEFSIPTISSQNNIAITLSRYDSLIENYQKQIKLLEEAAQRLYKEWFVDLHFPGHENTKITDGVPEGWEKKKVGEIAEINKRNIPKNYEYTFVNYTDLGNVRLGKMDTPIRYNYGEEPGRAKRVAVDGDIIWGMVRPNLKSYALVQYPKEQDVFSTGFAVLTAKRVPFSFLYCYVTTEAFVGYLVNCTNGAAYPAVKPEHFSKAEIVIPSKCTMDVFNRLVEPMFRRVGKFQSQIRLLTEARDRLLPKLMSGEID